MSNEIIDNTSFNEIPDLSMPTIPSKGKGENRKRHSTEVQDIRKKAFNILETVYQDRVVRNEFTLLGEEVAMKIKSLPTPYARSTAKFRIQTLLYEASIWSFDEPSIIYEGNNLYKSITYNIYIYYYNYLSIFINFFNFNFLDVTLQE